MSESETGGGGGGGGRCKRVSVCEIRVNSPC